ncbi:hypothetical protein DSO57_1021294 [Entomophthora muscae]|uniref:Uncharacterized protein n=1 Tax=Entomophthora muscae TaxID=34485 RepID=A0ACC2TQY1_9FUNG|nr:hypothetical protein DSO57_1021294 [Entomophthora muscae]
MYPVCGDEDPLCDSHSFIPGDPSPLTATNPGPPSPHSGCWSLLPGAPLTGHPACTPRNSSP